MPSESIIHIQNSKTPSFDVIFSKFINLADCPVIMFQFSCSKWEQKSILNYEIISVAGSKTLEDFNEKCSAYIMAAVRRLLNIIKPYSIPVKIDFVKHAIDHLKSFTTLIVDGDGIDFIYASGDKESLSYKLFSSAQYFDEHKKPLSDLPPSVIASCHSFASAWLEILDKSISDLNQISSILNNFPELISSSAIPGDIAASKINTSLSVPQLAYFFALFIKQGIIKIPSGGKSDFYKWLSLNFRTDNTAEISTNSIGKSASSPDYRDAQIVHKHLIHLMQLASKDT